ncbi:MAG: serine/threonine protein kinase, partial [Sandaracinaceae bacterium]|nr:serine/threonine protein kinase [Sandaracinaceae bacterium]
MKVCATCRAKWRGNPSVCPLDGGALEELPDPLIGRTIAGRYVVVERVGSGGMGSVYRARHELVDRDVAIKFLAPELALDATNRQRFLREARAANRIDHEHIIDITDFGETEDGLCFLVMEYLDGGSLADVLRDGPLPARRAVDIGIQIASALARAHELDVIHRDIKPANVVLLRRADHHDFVKLLDFGLAKMKGEIQLTLTGTVFGTPEYMAPEQARGMDLSAKADLYAFGCVLYEMLAGAPPFQGATPDLILKHLRERPERLSSRVPDIDPTLDALVMRLLAKEPSERHADAHHVLEDLRRVAARLPVTSPPRRAPATARAAATEPPTTSVVAGTWESRARFFARLAQRAHPGGAPAWLAAAIAELTAWAKELASMHDEQARATETVMRLEEDVRNGRLRIGKALDVLAEDESRSARRATEIEAEQASAAAELESLEQ